MNSIMMNQVEMLEFRMIVLWNAFCFLNPIESIYILKNMLDSDGMKKYEQNIWLPCFPELKDYNMDYFKEVYVNSQILQRMLMGIGQNRETNKRKNNH